MNHLHALNKVHSEVCARRICPLCIYLDRDAAELSIPLIPREEAFNITRALNWFVFIAERYIEIPSILPAKCL